MSRLHNVANFGFQALYNPVAEIIATFVVDDHDAATLIDPCCGLGVAAAIIAEGAGIPKHRRRFNELHDDRAVGAREHADHVTHCDTLKGLQASKGLAQIGYVNPPFDQDIKEEGGGRLEVKFFRRVIEEGKWVQPGGVAILVTPQDIFARQEACNHMARSYDDIRAYRLPDEYRRWRETVVFGVVRATERIGIDQREEAKRLRAMFQEELPVLEAQPVPLYHLPKPQVTKKKVTWRDGTPGTPLQAMHDVARGDGGAFSSKKYRGKRDSMSRPCVRPLGPLHPAQAAIRIANGEINGRRVVIAGQEQLIKGSTYEDTKTWEEQKNTDNARIKETHAVTRRVPMVVTVGVEDHDAGTVRMYKGDQGLATLMGHPGTAENLLTAVTESAPPKYALDMDDDTARWLAELQRADGRSLPGQAPGLLPMQQHIVAAIIRSMTTYDAAWGCIPRTAFLAAEMGSGKSTMGAAISHVLHRIWQKANASVSTDSAAV